MDNKNCDVIVKESAVGASIRDLNHEIKIAKETQDVVCDRLDDVLKQCPEKPGVEKDKAVDGSMSPLATELYSIVIAIRDMTRRYNNVLERLEL